MLLDQSIQAMMPATNSSGQSTQSSGGRQQGKWVFAGLWFHTVF